MLYVTLRKGACPPACPPACSPQTRGLRQADSRVSVLVLSMQKTGRNGTRIIPCNAGSFCGSCFPILWGQVRRARGLAGQRQRPSISLLSSAIAVFHIPCVGKALLVSRRADHPNSNYPFISPARRPAGMRMGAGYLGRHLPTCYAESVFIFGLPWAPDARVSKGRRGHDPPLQHGAFGFARLAIW